MLNFLKNLFGIKGDYDSRVYAAIRKFGESDNPYDVRVAQIMAANRDKMLDWNEVDKILADPSLDRSEFRRSVIRFQTELS